MTIYEKKVVCNDRRMEREVDYEKEHTRIWCDMENIQRQIQRTFNNCWYPYSIKLLLVKRFISIYRQRLSFLEDYLSLSNNQDSRIKLEGQIKIAQEILHDFEEQLNELYLKFNQICC